MKYRKICKSLFYLLFLPLLSIDAQEYFPFPQDSAVWYVVDSWPEYDPPPPVWYKTYLYETNGDTVINNTIYTKLYSENAFGTSGFRKFPAVVTVLQNSE